MAADRAVVSPYARSTAIKRRVWSGRPVRSESTRARKLPGSYQVALIAVLALTGAGFGLGAAGYRINATNSLPPGIWKVVALDSPPAHGDIVSVCPPAVKALEDAKSRGYLHTGTCS